MWGAGRGQACIHPAHRCESPGRDTPGTPKGQQRTALGTPPWGSALSSSLSRLLFPTASHRDTRAESPLAPAKTAGPEVASPGVAPTLPKGFRDRLHCGLCHLGHPA